MGMNIRHQVIPAEKRLEKLDILETELERGRLNGSIDLVEYTTTKHALTLRRNKEWASLCRAMGWPIEYNPLTYDPELSPEPEPEPEIEEIRADTDPPEVRKKRHLHYKIFLGWVVFGIGLYWWLSG